MTSDPEDAGGNEFTPPLDGMGSPVGSDNGSRDGAFRRTKEERKPTKSSGSTDLAKAGTRSGLTSTSGSSGGKFKITLKRPGASSGGAGVLNEAKREKRKDGSHRGGQPMSSMREPEPVGDDSEGFGPGGIDEDGELGRSGVTSISGSGVREKVGKSRKDKTKPRKKRKVDGDALHVGGIEDVKSSSACRAAGVGRVGSPPPREARSYPEPASSGDRELAGMARKSGAKKKMKRKEAKAGRDTHRSEPSADLHGEADSDTGAVPLHRVSSGAPFPRSSGEGPSTSSVGRPPKKKRVKVASGPSLVSSMLEDASTVATAVGGYSAAQKEVNDMMRRALEENEYSAHGSIVDTDSSDDDEDDVDNHDSGLVEGVGVSSSRCASVGRDIPHVDRSILLAAMRKQLRMEAKQAGNTVESPSKAHTKFWIESSEGGGGHDAAPGGLDSRAASIGFKAIAKENGEGLGTGTADVDGNARKGGKKRKKKKGKKGGRHADPSAHAGRGDEDGEGDGHSRKTKSIETEGAAGGNVGNRFQRVAAQEHGDDCNHLVNNEEEHVAGENTSEELVEEESSIFGQTTGSTNSTWVQCEKCNKWRRLRGVVDAKKLPTKWYCSMNKNDPERARCTAPEEDYDTPPESAQDQRARKHLRLWVRRLHVNEAYEARLPTMTRGKRRSGSAKEPYDWVRCCNPSCGKWRALLKCMDVGSVLENARDGQWFCVMNTWDEKMASCAAPQEMIPAIGCPPWVMQD